MPAPYYDDLYSDLPIEGDDYEGGNEYQELSSEEAVSSEQAQSLHHISISPENFRNEVQSSDHEEDISQYLSPADGFHSSSSAAAQYSYVYPDNETGIPVNPAAASALGSLSVELGASQNGLDRTAPVVVSGTQPTSAAVPNIPNVLVEDPSLVPGSTAESKAREARRERARSESLNTPADSDAPADPVAHHQRQVSVQTSSSSGIQQQHSRQASTSSVGAQQQGHSRQPSRQHGERTPLFNLPSEAPPAYTPSPTSPTTSQSPEGRARVGSNQSQSRSGYQTFPNIAAMGREGEDSQWLLGHGGPESMGNPEHGPNGSQDGDGVFYRRKKPMNWWRNIIVRFLFFALLVSVFAGFLAGIARAVQGSGKLPNSDRRQKDRTGQTPIHNPLPSDGRDGLRWEPYPQCASGIHTFDPQSYPLSFSPSVGATVVQTIEDKYPGHGGSSEWHVDVRGDVILRRVDSDHDAGFDVEVLANSEDLVVSAQWDSDRQYLTLTIPRVFEWHQRLRPCIQMRVTARVPEGAELQQFQAVAVHLDISADSDFDLKASTFISLETVSGDVRVHDGAKLDCRSISIHTVSGDISGSLPLYDKLDIASASGDVDCQVNPHPVDESNPKPATLKVGTMSGDIRIQEPISDSKIPARNYAVDLETYSGDINADIAASSSLVLETNSGTIRSKVLPVLDPDLHKCGNPAFTISTYSGDQKFSVLDPVWVNLPTGENSLTQQSVHIHKERVLDCLASSHSTISGDVDVKYPSSWSGRFSAQTVSGSLKATGKDVVVDSRISKPGLKSIKGHHYDGDSALSVAIVSRDVTILIGDE